MRRQIITTTIVLAVSAVPATAFDHGELDRLLKAHVSDGMVDYVGLAKEKAALETYVQSLAGARLSRLSRDEQKALYINAYNAATLLLILEHGGDNLKSIMDIPEEKRWKHVRWNVAGKTYSLDDIEHKVLRPQFKDARIHAAINCASVGCPPLRAGAYVGSGLQQTLNEQSRTWINDERFVHVKDGSLWVSEIFNWFKDDFVVSAGSIRMFVGYFAEPPLRDRLDALGRKPQVKSIKYDWSLNRAKK